jgi:hypothetical protein
MRVVYLSANHRVDALLYMYLMTNIDVGDVAFNPTCRIGP